MQQPRFVSYVVGTILCFPIYCIHWLPVFKEKPKSKNNYPSTQASFSGKQKKQCTPTEQGVKRSCGQSQKSTRVKHNSVPALKRK